MIEWGELNQSIHERNVTTRGPAKKRILCVRKLWTIASSDSCYVRAILPNGTYIEDASDSSPEVKSPRVSLGTKFWPLTFLSTEDDRPLLPLADGRSPFSDDRRRLFCGKRSTLLNNNYVKQAMTQHTQTQQFMAPDTNLRNWFSFSFIAFSLTYAVGSNRCLEETLPPTGGKDFEIMNRIVIGVAHLKQYYREILIVSDDWHFRSQEALLDFSGNRPQIVHCHGVVFRETWIYLFCWKNSRPQGHSKAAATTMLMIAKTVGFLELEGTSFV